jgi:uncharacterized membrane protein YkvI
MVNEDLHCAQILASAVIVAKHFFLDLILKLYIAHAFKAAHYLFQPLYAIMEMHAERNKINKHNGNGYKNPDRY